MEHLVYCDAKAKELSLILSGQKSMVVRGAAGRKVPYGRVHEGDILYFIENDGTGVIKARAEVSNVINSDKMVPDESTAMLDSYRDQLKLTARQEKRWAGKKYLCLIEFDCAQAVEPMVYDRQKNMDDWICCSKIDEILKR